MSGTRLFVPRDPALVDWTQEHITRAAIYTRDRLYIGEAGHRHHDVLRIMRSRRDLEDAPVQGFLTSSGRFVDRTVAARIAKRCGQLTPDSNATVLFSEDVW